MALQQIDPMPMAFKRVAQPEPDEPFDPYKDFEERDFEGGKAPKAGKPKFKVGDIVRGITFGYLGEVTNVTENFIYGDNRVTRVEFVPLNEAFQRCPDGFNNWDMEEALKLVKRA